MAQREPGLEAGAKAVKAVLHARRGHAALVDNIDGIVWEADPSFRFVFVSKQAERLLGYPVERWLEEPQFWVDHLHPEDRHWAPDFCMSAVQQCLPHEFEYRMLAADGRTVWLRDIVTVQSEEGRARRLHGIMVDVTEQRSAQERLEHTVSLLEATLDSTADGLLVVDRDGRVTAYNRQFKRLWGLSTMQDCMQDAALLNKLREQIKDPEPFLARLRALYETPEQESFDVIELQDGRVLERYSLPQWRRGVITGRVWSFRDITERVRAGRVQARLLEEAHEAIRVRDDFLTIAAHELKTPLTPLRLQLELMKRAMTAKEPVPEERVDKALAQVHRLTALINDLVDATSVEAGRLKLRRAPVSLHELAREACSDFRSISPEHAFTCELPPENLQVLGDRDRLFQVLANLLENAIKYSPMGGAVHVTVSRAQDNAVLTVTDAGIGIPEEEQARLFERFFRARNAPVSGFGGLGLGLYICRDIVEQHDGHIWVESELGQGSVFHVSLPLLPPRDAEE
ncbi:Chemotaxis protein methyltransferase CheR [Myxococcus hansupus]|uniref:histidine kinase n=1 Tax=Pseudomyxococcus hansupus TaxID=1297742 RepID=A0A0H4X124_9BACT|nr:PAS domain-containing sensor histidine kinase [Myxococcus hansupus]AKQ69386.1 Chemotaxis protein methyltransferase CheR [Myxococcus hansupus]